MKRNLNQLIQWISTQTDPIYFLTAGLPASGKSTFLGKLRETYPDFVVASTDDVIEREVAKMGLTYAEGFHKVNFKQANSEVKQLVVESVKARKSLINDQTNVSSKTRRSKVEVIPKSYVRACLVFDVPDDVLRLRLAKRAQETGKFIPDYVIRNMTASWQTPTRNEGFDYVFEISQS